MEGQMLGIQAQNGELFVGAHVMLYHACGSKDYGFVVGAVEGEPGSVLVNWKKGTCDYTSKPWSADRLYIVDESGNLVSVR